MRAAILAILALALAGCEHMYGAGDVVLSDAEAIRVAHAYARRHNIDLTGMTAGIGRFDTGTSITFTDPQCVAGCLDYLPLLFFIPQGKRQITHFQDSRP